MDTLWPRKCLVRPFHPTDATGPRARVGALPSFFRVSRLASSRSLSYSISSGSRGAIAPTHPHTQITLILPLTNSHAGLTSVLQWSIQEIAQNVCDSRRATAGKGELWHGAHELQYTGSQERPQGVTHRHTVLYIRPPLGDGQLPREV